MGELHDIRGRCPSCGSGDVVHYLYGHYLPDPLRRLPEWVHLAGFMVYPGHDHDRECGACGNLWYAELASQATVRRAPLPEGAG